MARDPILRLRKYMTNKGIWDDAKQAKLEERAKTIVSEIVKTAEGIEKPTNDDIFDYTFATLTPELEKQKATMRTSSLGQDPEQAGLSQKEMAK